MTKKTEEETAVPAANDTNDEEVMLKSSDVGTGIAPEEAPVAEVAESEPEDASQKREAVLSPPQSIFKKVSSVVFGVLSPKMIKKMASAKVVTPELYDK